MFLNLIILQSINMIYDSVKDICFILRKGIKADKRIKYLLDNSLMLVTALAPKKKLVMICSKRHIKMEQH